MRPSNYVCNFLGNILIFGEVHVRVHEKPDTGAFDSMAFRDTKYSCTDVYCNHNPRVPLHTESQLLLYGHLLLLFLQAYRIPLKINIQDLLENVWW